MGLDYRGSCELDTSAMKNADLASDFSAKDHSALRDY